MDEVLFVSVVPGSASTAIHAVVCFVFSIGRLRRILRGLEDAREKNFTSAGLKHGCLLSFVTVPVLAILLYVLIPLWLGL